MNITRSPWPDKNLKVLEEWMMSPGATLFRKHVTELRDAILLECAEGLLTPAATESGYMKDKLELARKLENALEIFNKVDSLRSGQLRPESVIFVAGP